MKQNKRLIIQDKNPRIELVPDKHDTIMFWNNNAWVKLKKTKRTKQNGKLK
jgi:hypothetical protein